MEEARAVLARLDRIEAMESGGDLTNLLIEIDLLVLEAERWLEREGQDVPDARRALQDCLFALSRAPRPAASAGSSEGREGRENRTAVRSIR
jgi:hypothetical protein